MTTHCPLTIFFDGACGVCSKEMTYYRSIADERLIFIDISADDFCPQAFGKSQLDFQRELHVCDSKGNFFTGVDAFRKLWDTLPSPFYPLLSSFTGLPGIHLAARGGYKVFAKFRHLLPNSAKSSCQLPRH